MNVLENLIYIIGGLALTRTFSGNAKLIKALAISKPVSLVHLLYSLVAPLVIWQHIFQFIEHLYSVPKDEINLFLISINSLINLSLLVAITYILHPRMDEYHMECEEFQVHLVANRRVFYFLILFYLIGVMVSNISLQLDNEPLIIYSRIAILTLSCIGFLVCFEIDEMTGNLKLQLRIPYPVRENCAYGLDLNKAHLKILLARFKPKRTVFTQQIKIKIYRKMDFLICTGTIMAFIMIAYLRNV